MLTEAQWQNALERFPERELAHTWAWREIITQVYGYRPIYTMIEHIPVTAFLVKGVFSGKKITSMPFMFQAPTLGKEPICWEKILRHFESLAVDNNCYAEIKLRHPLPAHLIQSFKLTEHIASIFSSIVLAADLEQQELYYPKNLRKKLKRLHNQFGRSTEFSIRQDTDPQTITQFHHCMVKMYRDKDHIPCQPLELFLRIGQQFGPIQEGRLFSVWHAGNLVSGIFVLQHANTAEYAWGATLPGYEKYNFPTLLLDQAIQWAISLGCTSFSLGCTNPTDLGLLDFKARWGAIQTQVYFYYLGKNIRPTNLTAPNPLIGEVYRHLPLWLIKMTLPAVVPYLV
jgi:hypothetical protein